MKDYPISPISLAVNPILIQAPLPGGATATTVDQLKEMGMLDKFPKVIENMKEVVARGGFGTSVTPVSQFYAQQSFLNAITEKPWDQANPGYAKMVLGYFGKTPVDPDPELVKWASEKLGIEPTTETVVDLNDKDPEKGLKAAEERRRQKQMQQKQQIQQLEKWTQLSFDSIIFDSEINKWSKNDSEFDEIMKGRKNVIVMVEDEDQNGMSEEE